MTKRSTVENVIYRYEAIIGREMRSRAIAGQRIKARRSASHAAKP